MELFLALMACADYADQLGRPDVEAEDVARPVERDGNSTA